MSELLSNEDRKASHSVLVYLMGAGLVIRLARYSSTPGMRTIQYGGRWHEIRVKYAWAICREPLEDIPLMLGMQTMGEMAKFLKSRGRTQLCSYNQYRQEVPPVWRYLLEFRLTVGI